MKHTTAPAHMTSEYQIIQWNCNGFNNHIDDTKLLISNINCLAICIQESKFKSNYHKNIKNFKCFYKNLNTTNTAHGGVCIYVNNMVEASELQLNTDLQAIAIKISFPIKCILCSIYLPGSETLSKSSLNNLINQFDLPYMLLGDFNSHNTMWGSEKTDQRGKIIYDFINENDINLMNNINCPTHFSLAYKSFSHIDLSLISPQIARYFEWTVCDDLHNSDHYPILIKYKDFSPSLQRRETWNINKAKWDNFQCELKGSFNAFNSINDLEEHIVNSIIESAKNAIPIKSSTVNKRQVPWWNHKIKTLIKERRKLLKKFKNNMNSENLANYLKMKATIRKEIRASRKKSWITFCESINLRTSSSTVFRKIRSLNGSTNHQQINFLKHNDTLVTNPKDIADLFAKQFANNSSSSNYSSSFIDYSKTKQISLNFDNNGEPYNSKFSMLELKSALKMCKGSSPGPDNIRYEMLKKLNDISLQYILDFYNLIWTERVFPDKWRKALVIPVLKPGKDSAKQNNYRPISLTNCLCKLLERMINRRLIWYLETKNILNINQSAFRKNRGTIDNLAILHSDIMESFSTKKDLVAVFFDLCKAYDCVWRKLILEKLNRSEIKGNMISFISNFLTNRKFSVLVGNTHSKSYYLENGVPQGSILSVTLFLLAIDSIFNNIKPNVKSLLYADDLVIYSSGNNISTITKHIQCSINKLLSWNNKTGFKFNAEKTVAIKFSRRRKQNDINISLKLDDNNIQFVNKHKFLGVIFDEKLSFHHHIQHIKAKANSKLSIIKMLRCTKFGSDQQSLLKILNSIVLPTIDYASIIYNSASSSRLKTLDTILNTGIRLSLGAFRTSPTSSLLALSSNQPLNYRRLKHLLNYTLKIFSLKTHPFYSMLNNTAKVRKFEAKSLTYQPLYTRAYNEMLKVVTKFPIDIKNINPLSTSTVAPWTFTMINLNLRLAYINKRNMIPEEVHQRYLEIINSNYKNFIKFYTDGSVINEKSGFAYFGDHFSTKIRTCNYSSIYTCELLAIKVTLEKVRENYHGANILIISDSKSSLEGLDDNFSRNSLVQEIREILCRMSYNYVEFLWVPSHFNIYENDKVDKLAKDSLKDDINLKYKYQFPDYRRQIKKYVHDQWNEEWVMSSRDSKLFKLINHIPYKYTHPSLKRKDLSKLNRLKIGHTLLTHKYIIEKSAPPICICTKPLTIYHIFNECTSHENIKNKYKIKDISILLEEDKFENIKQFLTDINVYNLI